MKTIITLAALVIIVTSAVGSAFFYLNENFLVSGALVITCFLSLSLWIRFAGMNKSKKHAQ
jgi:hypothetical protein